MAVSARDVAEIIPEDCYEGSGYVDYDLDMSDASSSHSNQLDGVNADDDDMSNLNDSSAADLYGCTLMVHKRQFKGQSSGSCVARWELSAGSGEEFMDKVWNLSKEHLAREIVFPVNPDGTTRPEWSPDQCPQQSDFGKFALFQSGRRSYTVDKILDPKSALLQNWRNKEISLFLHVYSMSVSSRSLWVSVKDLLIQPTERDRAGASTTQAVLELAGELRAMHENQLEGHGMAWSFWANAILSSPAHLRESQKNFPPRHLAHLFRAKEGPHVGAIRKDLAIAHNVNNSYHEEIAGLRREYDVMEACLENLVVAMKSMKGRLEALELRDKVSDSMLGAMQQSVEVQEDELGCNLRHHIVDIDDVDHI